MGVPESASPALRVALLSRSERQRKRLNEILQSNGLEVVPDEELRAHLPGTLPPHIAHVVLVDLDEQEEWESELLDALMDQTDIPVLFNEGAATRKPATLSGRAWGRRLAGKLIELVESHHRESQSSLETSGIQEHEPHAELRLVEEAEPGHVGAHEVAEQLAEAQETVVNTEVADMVEDVDLAEIQAMFEAEADQGFSGAVLEAADAIPGSPAVIPATGAQAAAERVWVLGASIGGPQALKSFLSLLPDDLPMCFILAQHIGAGFLELLGDQLGRATPLNVRCATPGHCLQHGEIVIAPVEQRVVLDPNGVVSLEPVIKRSIYNPCIDDVMTEVAARYRGASGAIVFSGMGSDGLVGCKAIAGYGGTVWAQDESTCVISSMADSVRTAGLVSLTASPEALARELVKFLQEE